HDAETQYLNGVVVTDRPALLPPVGGVWTGLPDCMVYIDDEEPVHVTDGALELEGAPGMAVTVRIEPVFP
ncbi:hypothetical protein, partial [Roseibium sp. RKSG952]|uniref:hypothetical protein n=1 Tax=Roseibium sp. RKSG952 TaxID=2529384 RepID=UPI0018AD1CA6